MFNHRFRYLLILGLGTYSYLNAVFAEVFDLYSIRAPWYLSMLTMLLLTLAVWEGNRMIAFLADKRFPGAESWRRLLVSFGIGIVISVIAALLITGAIGFFLAGIPFEKLRLPFKLSVLYATRINLFLHTIHAISVFLYAYRQKELETESLKRIGVQAQLQAVRNQVNPHFLFNNLNVLSGMIIKDNPEANEFVEAFSKVYRRVLNTQDESLVTLGSEMEYIQPYIFLLKKRFVDSLTVSISIPEQFLQAKVIPGAIQMLLENAVKHNIVSKKFPLLIDISVNGMTSLIVSNNLQVKEVIESSTQIGLNNIRQRYMLTTGKSIQIMQDGNSFSVGLPLIT